MMPAVTSLRLGVRWRGRLVAIRIAGRAVEATPVGEPMEIRIGVASGNGEQHAAASLCGLAVVLT